MEFHVAVSFSRGSEPWRIRWREPWLTAYPEVGGLPGIGLPDAVVSTSVRPLDRKWASLPLRRR